VDSRLRGNDGVGEHPFDANDATIRGSDGERWQPRFFDHALGTVKEKRSSTFTLTRCGPVWSDAGKMGDGQATTNTPA
jgi:hypothetical protein